MGVSFNMQVVKANVICLIVFGIPGALCPWWSFTRCSNN